MLTTVGSYGMQNAFRANTKLTGSLSFPALTSIGDYGMQLAFMGCKGITGSVSFPSLTPIGSNGMQNAFRSAGITEIHFKQSLSDNSELTTTKIFGTTSGKSVIFDLP